MTLLPSRLTSGKESWRRWAAQVRLPAPADINDAVVAALHAFLDEHSGNVLTYQPMDGELDLLPLLDRPDASRFHTTRTPDTGPLTVHAFGGPTERHRYGFAQPSVECPPVDPAAIGIVLVPGVLFGRDGTRLGHGAGYYDRLLPSVAPSACLVAIAWRAILAPTVPVGRHDVRMTHLCTELGVMRVD